MKLFVDNAPSFYRINLLNELAKQIDVCIAYTKPVDFDKSRNQDFYGGKSHFKSVYLKGSPLSMVVQVYKFISSNNIDEAVIGGWGCYGAWLFLLLLPKKKNSCIIESSIYESSTTGLKGLIKKIFLKKCSKVYAAGLPQARLAKALNFKGEIKITGGCGLLNYKEQPVYVQRNKVQSFLYVGRFVEVKNLKLLVKVFSKLPQLNLKLAGYGELEQELKSIATDNVFFLGEIKNADLWRVYRDADVFILPSVSETWGLVVEEALNNGLPVIVSDKVGCREDLVTTETGLVFNHDDEDSLMAAITRISNVETYNRLREGVSKLNFSKRALQQINVFIE